MNKLPEALAPLAAYKQFILYTEADKYPRHPTTGALCNAHDPAVQMDATTALAIAEASPGYGVGFVFTGQDPFFFLDIDGCKEPDGSWSPLAIDLCTQLSGAAVEVSMSGRGLHIIGTGPTPAHGCKNIPLGIELYTEGRYVALTGSGAVGSVLHHPEGLNGLVSAHFAPSQAVETSEWTNKPVEAWKGPEDDFKLIEKMLASRSAGAVFGNRATIQDLWNGEDDALATAYPDQTGDRGFDHSSADAALCQHLAFWTGKDCERIDRLFRMSKLTRDKWVDREDYRRMTIIHAVSHCTAVYGGKRKAEIVEADGMLPEGDRIMTITQVAEFFKGFVYVRDVHRVYTPDGALLKPDQFKAYYAGRLWAMDAYNDDKTKNAFEAFVENRALTFPRAHSICFRPELPSGAMVEEDGPALVNTYTPAYVTRTPGDASPFLTLLQRMLPNDNDRAILLAYMASLVQNPGVKFQWCPLLQGVEGNGKTFLMKCMTRAVGQRYTHLPNAQDFGGGG